VEDWHAEHRIILLLLPHRNISYRTCVGAIGNDVGVNACEFILKWQRRMMGEPKM
jgi:hypothetical protein